MTFALGGGRLGLVVAGLSLLVGFGNGGMGIPTSAIGAEEGARPESDWPIRLVVTQLPRGTASEQLGPRADGMLPADYGAGARLVVVQPDGAVRPLTPGFHSACDPELSFDARRVLFAGKRRPSDPWNIFEVGIHGDGLRQITREDRDCRSPRYQSALYRLPPVGVPSEPWRQITFVAPAGTRGECGRTEATHLYACKRDGSAVRRLTYNLSSDRDPVLMDDGRLVFAARQRRTLEHGLLGRIRLLGVNLDGTDYALYAQSGPYRVQHMPCATEGGLVVFVQSDQLPWDGAGALGCVRIRRPLHSYRPLTRPTDGLFHSPSPLPDGRVLVSWRPADGSGTHGVYRFDPATGKKERLFDDPRYHDIQARAIVPRDEPDGRSSVVTEKDPHGRIYCLNVYLHDLPDRSWLAPGSVRRLRVVEGAPVPAAGSRGGGASLGGRQPGEGTLAGPPLAPRRILGQVDVHPDGSFCVEVPANVPIELQILDQDGLALRSCGWIWARNRESRGCIGCHEDGELTPENWLVDAMRRKPVPVTAAPAERRGVDFRHDVMPVIRSHCLPCHGPEGASPVLGRGRLRGQPRGPDAEARAVYQTLLAQTPGGDGGLETHRYVHPGRARTSPLIWHVLGRNTARPWDQSAWGKPVPEVPGAEGALLDGEPLRTLITWIDLGASWDAGPEPAGKGAQ